MNCRDCPIQCFRLMGERGCCLGAWEEDCKNKDCTVRNECKAITKGDAVVILDEWKEVFFSKQEIREATEEKDELVLGRSVVVTEEWT